MGVVVEGDVVWYLCYVIELGEGVLFLFIEYYVICGVYVYLGMLVVDVVVGECVCL